MTPNLVGLGGYAASGKDTFADYLVEHYGWQKTYMSRPLEEALLRINPYVPEGTWDGEKWSPRSTFTYYNLLHAKEGYDASKRNPEVRRLLQVLGTEVGRKMFGEDIWVDLAFQEIGSYLEQGISVALTGVRFPNELETLRKFNGTSIWVDRGLEPVNSHASDNTLGPNDFDWVFPNTGDLPALYEKIEIWTETLNGADR